MKTVVIDIDGTICEEMPTFERPLAQILGLDDRARMPHLPPIPLPVRPVGRPPRRGLDRRGEPRHDQRSARGERQHGEGAGQSVHRSVPFLGSVCACWVHLKTTETG